MTILWIIERLLVKPTEGSLIDVVITADWRCNGFVQSPTEAYSGTCYGSCSFQPPSGDLTPYEDLTEAQVIGWCYANGVDQAAIEANVTQQINDQINPPVIAPPLPWAASEGVSSGDLSKPLPTLRDEQIVDPMNLPTSDVPPSVDGMSTNILG
jgi:hypothetical protein